jgi:hypothetical protein
MMAGYYRAETCMQEDYLSKSLAIYRGCKKIVHFSAIKQFHLTTSVSHLRFRRPLLLIFWPLTALILYLDGRAFGGETSTSQWISNAIAPLFLFAVMRQLKPSQQLIFGALRAAFGARRRAF